MNVLAENLQEIMDEESLSQRALSERTGVNRETIRHALKGDHVRPDTVRRLAEGLGVPVKRLTRGEPEDVVTFSVPRSQASKVLSLLQR
jgi:transcriptional regulator with XRE-family HTH domain